MLALPLKGADKKSDIWSGPLSKYIKATYGKRQAEAHTKEFSSVAEMRTLHPRHTSGFAP